jgi:sugar O-acyltransferase (sialic acid O-acetyltransferase NeuD family)
MNKKGYKEYELAGYLNDFVDKGKLIHEYPVLGNLKEVNKFIDLGYYFMWAVHMIGHGKKREKLFNDLNIPEDRLAKIIHPNAFVADNVEVEPGVFIMANSYIGPGTKIKKGTLIMANCVVGHDDEIDELCHLSAGCTVSSYVKIGKVSDIGLAASVLEKSTIGNYSVLGANSLLTKNMGDSVVWLGSPAKLHRAIEYTEE